MANLTEDQEICPHCGGTGRIQKKQADQFPIGSKIHWNMSWWRYPKGANGTVIAHSKSGKRVYIEYETNDRFGCPDFGKLRTFVSPSSLEIRE